MGADQPLWRSFRPYGRGVGTLIGAGGGATLRVDVKSAEGKSGRTGTPSVPTDDTARRGLRISDTTTEELGRKPGLDVTKLREIADLGSA